MQILAADVEAGTQILVAAYDRDGRMQICAESVWQSGTQLDVPLANALNAYEVRIFFLNDENCPIRTQVIKQNVK